MIDLLIKNALTINKDIIDIEVNKGKIVQVGNGLNNEAIKILDLKGKDYISAGWIDDHVHCFEKMDLYYDYPDKIGVEAGVTTIIDAGSTGAENIGDFYDLAKEKKTNVYAMLNVSKTGIVTQDELSDLGRVDESLINKSLKKYSDFIVGLKIRMSKSVVGNNYTEPLKKVEKIRQNLNLDNYPMMIHIGSEPPLLEDTFSLLRKGDIVSHCFNGKNNGILDKKTNKIKDFVWDYLEYGLLFDVGHGTDSFNFNVAETALKEGIKADTISTDIYSRNRLNGPVYNLSTTLDKMRFVGYSWPEIIYKITEKPAELFNLRNKGKIKTGFDADFTIFQIYDLKKELVDSNGNKRIANETIKPLKTIIGGEVYDVNL